MKLLLAALAALLILPGAAAAQEATVTGVTATSVTITYTGLAAGTSYTDQLLLGGSVVLSTPFSTQAPIPPVPRDGWAPAGSFYWQLQGTLAARHSSYDVSDVDGFDTAASTVTSLHNEGKHVVCYLSVGTWENWRPDAGSFPDSAKGKGNGWPGEKWLDTRDATVRQIMSDRVAMCADKGFDAVEFDNQDGYSNSTGFPLTAATQLDYNRYLASTAHNAGLAAVLKNDVDQVKQLEPDYDAALNEQCAQYSECGAYSAFTGAGKVVWQVEYGTKNANRCSQAIAAGRRAYYAGTNLSGSSRWVPC